jgi:hypothetical protein
MKKLLSLLLALAQPALAAPLESRWLDAAASFDNPSLSASVVAAPGALAPAPKPSLALQPAAPLKAAAAGLPLPGTPDIVGPGGIPKGKNGSDPSGIGPIERLNPNYATGLLGSLFGLLLAPLAFAFETAVSVALMPARMIKGLAEGDLLSLLEPVRTVKNVVQDAAVTAVGMANLATGPVWNAFAPSQATDFMFANDRLVFLGGPLGGLMNGTGVQAVSPSQHTVFARQGRVDYEHEFVHNKQWQKSFLYEKVGEDYSGHKDWNAGDAHEYLNW